MADKDETKRSSAANPSRTDEDGDHRPIQSATRGATTLTGRDFAAEVAEFRRNFRRRTDER